MKKGYHARVAQRLENAGNDSKLPLNEIAHHYAEAGNEEKAVKFAMEAGQDALARFSNAEAIKHFTFVLEKASSIPKRRNKKRVLEKLGDAYFANCMFKKALEVLSN